VGFVCRESLKGLLYLHGHNIIHRDVKAANILLTEEAQVKIADFGISDTIGKASDSIGTPLWMAPEVINKLQYDSRCDIWSLGITIIEMADGFPPYHKLKPKRAMMMVPLKPPPTVEDTSKWSPEFLDFLAQCLVKEPEKRPTATDLENHPFVQKIRGPEVLQQRIKCIVKFKKERERKLSKDSNTKSSGGSSGVSESSEESKHFSEKDEVKEDSSGKTSEEKNVSNESGTYNEVFGTSVVHESEDDENPDEENVDNVQEILTSALEQSNIRLERTLLKFKQDIIAEIKQNSTKKGLAVSQETTESLKDYIKKNLDNLSFGTLSEITQLVKQHEQKQ